MVAVFYFLVNIFFRGGFFVTFVDLCSLLGVAGSSLESSVVGPLFLGGLGGDFASRASCEACFLRLMLTNCTSFDVIYLCLFWQDKILDVGSDKTRPLLFWSRIHTFSCGFGFEVTWKDR